MATRKVSKIARDVEIAGSLRVANGINSPDFARNVTETVAAKQDARNAEVAAEAAEAAATAASAAATAASVLAQKPSIVFASSASSLTRSRSGAYTPATITYTAKLPDGTPYQGRIVIEETSDGETWAEVYRSAIDESSHEHTPSPAILGILAQLVDDLYVLKQLSIPVQESVDTAPVYLGSLTSLPSSGMLVNDYLFDARTAASGGGILRYWTGSTWAEMTDAHPLYQQAVWNALADMGQWATDQDTVIAAASAIFDKLVAKNAMLASLFVQQIDVPDGGRIRYYNGKGVQRRCVQLAADRIDFLDTPDTTPASDELLRARIGRLGVGGSVLMDGYFSTNIVKSWSAASMIAGSSLLPAAVITSNNVLRLAYRRISNGYMTEQTYSNGSWSAEATIRSALTTPCAYVRMPDGSIRLSYLRADSDSYLCEMVFSDGAWGSEIVINPAVSSSASYAILPTGELYVCYIAGNSIRTRTYSSGSWSDETSIVAENAYYVRLFATDDGVLRVAYNRRADHYLVERVFTSGAWGTESVIDASVTGNPNYVQLLSGELRIIYTNSSAYLVQRELNGSTWSSPSTIYSAVAGNPVGVCDDDGSIYLFFEVYAGGGTYYNVYMSKLECYARLGAGITEIGSNANGAEYWKLGDEKIIYPTPIGGAVNPGNYCIPGFDTYSDANAFTGNTYAKAEEYKIPFSGIVRVRFKIKSYNSTYTVYGRVYKNGVAVAAAHSTNSTSPVSFYDDISVVAGDLVQIYISGQYASTTCYLSDCALCSSGPGRLYR